MKKLLMLLVFSASFFASAQELTIAQINTPSGETIQHVYVDRNDDRFLYQNGYSQSSVATYTFDEATSTFTDNSDSYRMLPSFLLPLRTTLRYLTSNDPSGYFYQAPSQNRILITPSHFLRDNQFVPLEDAGWDLLDEVSNSREVRYEIEICGQAYRAIYTSNNHFYIFIHGGPRAGFLIEEGNTQSRTYQTGAEVLAAVAAYADFIGCCTSTANSPSDKYPILNDGRDIRDYVPGVTNWEPQGITNTVWTYSLDGGFYYEIRENDAERTFNLYRGRLVNGVYVGIAGDSGASIGDFMSFTCLEELVDELQN